jgi:hypothetical protein
MVWLLWARYLVLTLLAAVAASLLWLSREES